jgi:hypothetical protein
MSARLFLLLVSAILMLSLAGARAQGYLNFANIGGGPAGTVNAPLTNASVTPPVRVSGNSVLVMLYVAPAGTTDELLLTTNGVQGGPVGFNTGAQAGYFTGGQRTITGFNGGQTVTVQVRAWIASAGATYEAARAFDPFQVAESNLIQIVLQSAPNTPNNLVGLQFVGAIVPEPSTWALLGLGSALFWSATRRRRK